MPPWMHSDRKPCGTLAAARRHYRHGEPLCRTCKQAEQRDHQDRAARLKAGV